MKSEKLSSFTKELLQQGRYCFEKKEALNRLGSSKQAFANASNRLAKKTEIALVKEGFYIIIPPQYQTLGCLPVDWFIDDLMKYLDQPYYISLLSAASYYGATHQQPQKFQVMTNKQTRSITIGQISIEFITNRRMPCIGIKQINSYTSQINVSCPELTIIDVCNYSEHSGYIHNVAQIVSDLADSIDLTLLDNVLSETHVKKTVLQRLGFLLELTDNKKISDIVYKYLSLKKPINYIWLAPSENLEILEKDKRWKVNINERVELDT